MLIYDSGPQGKGLSLLLSIQYSKKTDITLPDNFVGTKKKSESSTEIEPMANKIPVGRSNH